MYILGISFGYHDSSVAILEDGRILGVYQEERFSRKKHDNGFPARALQYVVDTFLVDSDNIQTVSYYEDPILKHLRIRDQFKDIIDYSAFLIEKSDSSCNLNPVSFIARFLKIDDSKVVVSSHHLSHAFLAASLSAKPQDTGDVLTIDGVGEYDTCCHYSDLLQLYEKSSYRKTNIGEFPNSLGLFYSAITSFLGFEVNDAEYKVMGLAAYGEDVYSSEFQRLISINGEGKIQINLDYFQTDYGSPFPYKPAIVELLGLPAPASKFYAEKFTSIACVNADPKLKRYADIAHSAQERITNITRQIFDSYVSPATFVAYSGGVALNTKSNSSLMSDGYSLLVPPDPGDGGSSLGSALSANYFLHRSLPFFSSPYLGYDVSHDRIEAVNVPVGIRVVDCCSYDELLNVAADLLIENKVLGWVQGRAEFGPRALGNRSIIANPSCQDTQFHVNKAVKFREPFRPFAPAVLSEFISTLFEVPSIDIDYPNNPYSFMLATLPAKPAAYSLIPACIHVDGTSRVQSVSETLNPLFYGLISRFHAKSQIPALLNTSFNLRGEPMINNIGDAINTFSRSGLEVLIVNKYIFYKV
jgi:carbamoyltransferase